MSNSTSASTRPETLEDVAAARKELLDRAIETAQRLADTVERYRTIVHRQRALIRDQHELIELMELVDAIKSGRSA